MGPLVDIQHQKIEIVLYLFSKNGHKVVSIVDMDNNAFTPDQETKKDIDVYLGIDSSEEDDFIWTNIMTTCESLDTMGDIFIEITTIEQN